MRKIKFRLRIKDKIVGYEKWYEGAFSETQSANPCWLYSKDGKRWFPDYIYHTEKDQFTNLLDNDDKEIYAGDKVIVPNQYPFFDEGVVNYIGIVEWIDCNCAFEVVLKCVNKKKRGISDGVNNSISEYETDDGKLVLKVIGNIYESKT